MSKRIRMCANCRYWERLQGNLVCPAGVCGLTRTVENRAVRTTVMAVAKTFGTFLTSESSAGLVTNPDFGCVQFERALERAGDDAT